MNNVRKLTVATLGAIVLFSISAMGQQESGSQLAADKNLSLSVRSGQGGVEVFEYFGNDRLLQPGDVISWIATPDTENTSVEVQSPETFEEAIQSHQDELGNVALWVQRGVNAPDWIIVPLTATAAASRESAPLVTVKAITDGVEVVTYNGTDGRLRPGDVITWVSNTVGDASGLLVDSAESFQSAVKAQQDKNGKVALWSHHVGEDPDWVIVTLGDQPMDAQHAEISIRVKAKGESLEVESYSGTDGLLQPGDLITWVSTPGSDDAGVQVTDSATFQSELRARQDSEGHVALFVQRRDNQPNWIIVPLTSTRRDQTEMPNDQSLSGINGGGMARQLDDSLIGKTAGDLRTVTISLGAELGLRWCPPGDVPDGKLRERGGPQGE